MNDMVGTFYLVRRKLGVTLSNEPMALHTFDFLFDALARMLVQRKNAFVCIFAWVFFEREMSFSFCSPNALLVAENGFHNLKVKRLSLAEYFTSKCLLFVFSNKVLFIFFLPCSKFLLYLFYGNVQRTSI